MPVPMETVLIYNGSDLTLRPEHVDRVRAALTAAAEGVTTLVDISPRVGEHHVLIGPGIPADLRVVPKTSSFSMGA